MNDEQLRRDFEDFKAEMRDVCKTMVETLGSMTASVARSFAMVNEGVALMRDGLGERLETKELSIVDGDGVRKGSLAICGGRAVLLLADDAGRTVAFTPSLPGQSSENSGSLGNDADPQGP